MKAMALTVMIASLLGLVMLTLNIATVSVASPPGLMNPVVHFALLPGTRDEFLACLLASVIAAYFYAVVSWFDREIHRVRRDVFGDRGEEALEQPLDVRLLKSAIRSGDLAAVRRCATRSAFTFADAQFMTPVELAELYGRPDVIRAVRQAAARFAADPPTSAPRTERPPEPAAR